MMTSAQGALPAFYLLIALFCVPPILSLRACLKRVGHVRRRGRRGLWPMAGAAVSAAALAFNLGVVGVAALGSGGTEIGRSLAVALGLSWLCFWIWLFVVVALRRRRRKIVY